MIDDISLTVPKELSFNNSSSPIRTLLLENNCLHRLVFKIRTNHKTALSINPTHDFIEAYSKRQIPIKLIEICVGVKLEINYAKATEDMIKRNDPKMTGVDKKDIKKCLVSIDVSEIIEKKVAAIDSPRLEPDHDLLNSSFASVGREKDKSSFFKPPTTEILDIVQQHPEEDEEEFQEKKKKLRRQIQSLETQIGNEQELLGNERQKVKQSLAEKQQKQIMSPYILALVVLLSFVLGQQIKELLY